MVGDYLINLFHLRDLDNSRSLKFFPEGDFLWMFSTYAIGGNVKNVLMNADLHQMFDMQNTSN